MLKATFSCRLGANPFSQRSVACLYIEDPDRYDTAVLKRFVTSLASSRYNLHLDIDGAKLDRMREAETPRSELTAICGLILQRKTGIWVAQSI